ncbi:LacI family DNA-binding transcriptional regulator [Cellulomonas hominis]
MAVTLRQVAELAGVSVRTVSNVVNDFEHVAPHTRARVQKAVDVLGYRPNTAARSLRTGRTGLIGLVVPALDQPYFAELARAVVTQASAAGFTLVVDQTDGDPERERDLLLRRPRGAMFDGLILSPLSLVGKDLAEADGGRPLVLLGERMVASTVDHVHIDNVQAARDATEHLIARGHTRIAAIGLQRAPSGQTARQRTEGLMTALAEAGLPAHPQLLRHAESWDRSAGHTQMLELLDGPTRPDAVFCFSDMLAIGALRACFERGVAVPGDLAVMGFDDVEEARYATPSLSTVRPDKAEIAHAAVTRLVSRIEGAVDDVRDITVAHELVPRESTAAAGR